MRVSLKSPYVDCLGYRMILGLIDDYRLVIVDFKWAHACGDLSPSTFKNHHSAIINQKTLDIDLLGEFLAPRHPPNPKPLAHQSSHLPLRLCASARDPLP